MKVFDVISVISALALAICWGMTWFVGAPAISIWATVVMILLVFWRLVSLLVLFTFAALVFTGVVAGSLLMLLFTAIYDRVSTK